MDPEFDDPVSLKKAANSRRLPLRGVYLLTVLALLFTLTFTLKVFRGTNPQTPDIVKPPRIIKDHNRPGRGLNLYRVSHGQTPLMITTGSSGFLIPAPLGIDDRFLVNAPVGIDDRMIVSPPGEDGDAATYFPVPAR